MSMTPADESTIAAWAASLTEDDIPAPPPEPPPPDPITAGTLNRVRNQLNKRNGVKTPLELQTREKVEFNKRYSLEQMEAVVAAFWARIAEIQNPPE